MKPLEPEIAVFLRQILQDPRMITVRENLIARCPDGMSGDPTNYRMEAVALQSAKAEGFRLAIWTLFASMPSENIVTQDSPFMDTNKD